MPRTPPSAPRLADARPLTFADHVVNWLAEALPGEGTIFVDLDVDDNVLAHICFGCVVEWIDEIHHVESPLTKRTTNWRSSGCAAGRNA